MCPPAYANTDPRKDRVKNATPGIKSPSTRTE